MLMKLDWIHFTPASALLGGLLIGAAAALLLLGAGRILGASGILGGVIAGAPQDRGWRLSVLAGLLLSPTVLVALGKFDPPRIGGSWSLLIGAGLLVGIGTRLGSGCTSGHGICGNARLSGRSAAATALFMISAFVTVFVVRHVLA
jgi:uncharacterized membrane protein YedE/YeeE